MNLPTIRISPSELPKFNFLQYRNYLGEFKTEIDKARVRYNLGIPDSLSFKWGNIGGTIENQVDLILLVRQSVTNLYSSIVGTLDTLSNKVNTLTDNILTLNNEKNNIQILNNTYKQELEQRLLELEREVSLNATLIKLTGVDGTVVDLGSVNSAISSLRERVAALENNPGTSLDLTLLQNSISQLLNDKIEMLSSISSLQTNNSNLQGNINSLQNTIVSLQSEISRIKSLIGIVSLESISANRSSVLATTSSNKASIIIIASFDSGSTRDVTSDCIVESSNTNVAVWDNGISFTGIGNAVITFTYTYNGTSKTTTVNVIVTDSEALPTTPTQYVGYASSWSLVLGNQLFATTTIAKTWTQSNTPSIEASSMGFYIIATQNIASITNVFPYNVNETWIRSENYNGYTYDVYKLGPVTNTDNIITITIL